MLRHLLFNFIEIINGVVGICSFGLIQLDLPFKLAVYITKKDCEKYKDKERKIEWHRHLKD